MEILGMPIIKLLDAIDGIPGEFFGKVERHVDRILSMGVMLECEKDVTKDKDKDSYMIFARSNYDSVIIKASIRKNVIDLHLGFATDGKGTTIELECQEMRFDKNDSDWSLVFYQTSNGVIRADYDHHYYKGEDTLVTRTDREDIYESKTKVEIKVFNYILKNERLRSAVVDLDVLSDWQGYPITLIDEKELIMKDGKLLPIVHEQESSKKSFWQQLKFLNKKK